MSVTGEPSHRDGDPNERWVRLRDADAEGEFLTPEEREFMDSYRSDILEIEVERRLFDGLRRLGKAPARRASSHMISSESHHSGGLDGSERNPDEDAQAEALIASVVDRFLQEQLLQEQPGVAIAKTAARTDTDVSTDADESKSREVQRARLAAITNLPSARVRESSDDVVDFRQPWWRRSTLWVGAGTVAAAAALAVFIQLRVGPDAARVATSPVESLPSPDRSPDRLPTEAHTGEGEGRLVDGHDVHAESEHAAQALPTLIVRSGKGKIGERVFARADVVRAAQAHGSSLAKTIPIRAFEDLCVGIADGKSGKGSGAELCLAPGSRARWSPATGELELVNGRADMSVPSGVQPVERMQLVVSGVRFTSVVGNYSVESYSADKWRLAVAAGDVSVSESDGTVRASLRAGEVMRGTIGEGGSSTSSAGTLDEELRESGAAEHASGARKSTKSLLQRSEALARARALQTQGRPQQAAKVYEEFIHSDPTSPAARAAMVSLGQIYLALGRPERALASYERYLSDGGALAEEAEIGRIKALRALGDSARERAAIESFLGRYPASSYADGLRRSLR